MPSPSSALEMVASPNRSQTGNFCVLGPPLTLCHPRACFCCGVGCSGSAACPGSLGEPCFQGRGLHSKASSGTTPVLRLGPGPRRQHLLTPCSLSCFRAMQTGSGSAWAPRPGCGTGWDYSPGAQSSVVRGLPAPDPAGVCAPPQSVSWWLSWAWVTVPVRQGSGQAICLLRPCVASL